MQIKRNGSHVRSRWDYEKTKSQDTAFRQLPIPWLHQNRGEILLRGKICPGDYLSREKNFKRITFSLDFLLANFCILFLRRVFLFSMNFEYALRAN